LSLSFNPKLHNILGVGCSNGTVAIFDISEGAHLICTSKLEESHNDAITDFVWLRARTGTEFVTTSTDGKVIWWDIKEFQTPLVNVTPENPEKPLMLTDKDNDVEKEYGGVKIEYNPEAGV
jgi:dynein intermediate chain 2